MQHICAGCPLVQLQGVLRILPSADVDPTSGDLAAETPPSARAQICADLPTAWRRLQCPLSGLTRRRWPPRGYPLSKEGHLSKLTVPSQPPRRPSRIRREKAGSWSAARERAFAKRRQT